jgi:hypothetical protein
MATTCILLSSTVLGSTQNTVTISSIPSTYTDLLLNVSARNSSPGRYEAFRIEFNGTSANNYHNYSLRGNGSASGIGSGTYDNLNPYITANWGQGNGSTANIFSSHSIYIPSYASSLAKAVAVTSVTEENSGLVNYAWTVMTAGLWNNTSAINQIKFTSPGGYDYLTGSSFHLYGIKNS